jgi:hypothetical protein
VVSMMELVCFFSRRPGINPIPPGFSPIDIDIDFGPAWPWARGG